MNPNAHDFSWLWAALGAAVTQLVNWLLNKRKQDREIETSELDNTEKAIEIWRKTAEDMKAEVSELRAELKLLRDQVNKLQIENTTLKLKIEHLEVENRSLIEKIK